MSAACAALYGVTDVPTPQDAGDDGSSGSKAGSGNVNIDDAVSWSASTSLTLIASNNVNVNQNITATGGTAALHLDPNTANGSAKASGKRRAPAGASHKRSR